MFAVLVLDQSVWVRGSLPSTWVWTLTDDSWHDVHKKILIMKKIQENEDRRCRPTELTWKNIGGQFLNFKFVWGELNATFYQFFDVTNVLLNWKLGNTVFFFKYRPDIPWSPGPGQPIEIDWKYLDKSISSNKWSFTFSQDLSHNVWSVTAISGSVLGFAVWNMSG